MSQMFSNRVSVMRSVLGGADSMLRDEGEMVVVGSRREGKPRPAHVNT